MFLLVASLRMFTENVFHNHLLKWEPDLLLLGLGWALYLHSATSCQKPRLIVLVSGFSPHFLSLKDFLLFGQNKTGWPFLVQLDVHCCDLSKKYLA